MVNARITSFLIYSCSYANNANMIGFVSQKISVPDGERYIQRVVHILK